MASRLIENQILKKRVSQRLTDNKIIIAYKVIFAEERMSGIRLKNGVISIDSDTKVKALTALGSLKTSY
jgi:hypothetical protein